MIKLRKKQPVCEKLCISCFYHLSNLFKCFPADNETDHYCGYPEVNQTIYDTLAATNCPYFVWMDNELIKIVNGEIDKDIIYPSWWKGKKSLKYNQRLNQHDRLMNN